MIYTKFNREQARHLIGKEVKCWSGGKYPSQENNIFKGRLIGIKEYPFYFTVVDFYIVYRVGPSIYDDRTGGCFEYIKKATDENGNLTFDFA
mgnify:CR=1 FL=1